MQMNKQSLLLFVPILVSGMTFFSSPSVNAQQASWKGIVESDQAIWDRRITDEEIIQSIRSSARRIAENLAKIQQIRQDTLQKLRDKDCVSSAMAVEKLTRELEYYPHDRPVILRAIEQIKNEAGRQCNL